MGRTISQDQCPSSDSVHSESYGNHAQDMKSAVFFGNPDFSISAHSKISQSTMPIPYAHSDSYFSGLFTAYGPHTLIQPQMMGASSARVPLPVDLSEDGPIYVNAKQYHGILRRRKIRAKLEAQKKLVKTRKPYLHESRHRHALNRVRGSGGRFLSKKQPQQSDCLYPNNSQAHQDSLHFNQIGDILNADAREIKTNKHDVPTTTCTERTRIASADVIFPLAEGRFPPHTAVSMQGGSNLVYSGNRHYASTVR
ncbi:nuclear transcription factor Y subunit A-3 [Olea europaea subsp. europaea]|uniref:Nuclear transcription factor Y subunit n=1 Tax=Olea europaea subsp. europaea TaxID=158383 RepID=A0A8S0T9W0_OLEEU|nr:nuclear transcription factor Y subunit A-3 [Olea europaea subsp. europaea]